MTTIFFGQIIAGKKHFSKYVVTDEYMPLIHLLQSNMEFVGIVDIFRGFL